MSPNPTTHLKIPVWKKPHKHASVHAIHGYANSEEAGRQQCAISSDATNMMQVQPNSLLLLAADQTCTIS